MSTYVKARRSHSMPTRYSNYVVPSQEMGEYEFGGATRRRSAPSRPSGGGLYPLTEEGTYGPPPGPPPPPYKGRERKPKVYSSYAVDSGCNIHSKSLAKADKDHGSDNIRRRKASWSSTRSSRASQSPAFQSRRTVSASPSRRTSVDRPISRSSISPEPNPVRKISGGRKPSGYGNPSWATSSSSSSVSSSSGGAHRYSTNYSSSYRYGNNLRDSSFEENEEYEYEENQRRINNNLYNDHMSRKPPMSSRTNFSKFSHDLDSKLSGISLDAMRKPKVNSWDSMGILGLTTKIWNDTKKRQETFMESTGHFLREENIGSYIM